ncbi:MAG: hypothetical protein R3D98_00485 [Candidatus Krumholzibacteriia bacterium]
MRRHAYLVAGIAVTCLALSPGCTKLPPGAQEAGPLAVAEVTLSDAIPLAFGDLVSVTTNETYPGWAQLWFQREDRSIVAVYVHYNGRKLAPQALVIPRS